VDAGDFFKQVHSMNIVELRKNFVFLGEGIARAVFALNDIYAAKVAKCMDGDDQCWLENHIYRHEDSKIKKYLCPVVWYKKGMVVMPRAIPLSRIVPFETVDITKLGWGSQCYRDLVHLSKKYNLLFEDIVSTSSWGLINNVPVLIDYGCLD
jgi:hypothetical protein